MSRQQVLVDADWVAEHAGDENTVLVEVDEDTTAYDGGHISGAVKLDWKKDLQDPVRVTSSTRTVREAVVGARHQQRRHRVLTAATTTGLQRMLLVLKLYGTTRPPPRRWSQKWELDARTSAAKR